MHLIFFCYINAANFRVSWFWLHFFKKKTNSNITGKTSIFWKFHWESQRMHVLCCASSTLLVFCHIISIKGLERLNKMHIFTCTMNPITERRMNLYIKWKHFNNNFHVFNVMKKITWVGLLRALILLFVTFFSTVHTQNFHYCI